MQGQRHCIIMTVYADNAATTKTSETALKAMLTYMREIYGNPSSLHTLGQTAAEAVLRKEDICRFSRLPAKRNYLYIRRKRSGKSSDFVCCRNR